MKESHVDRLKLLILRILFSHLGRCLYGFGFQSTKNCGFKWWYEKMSYCLGKKHNTDMKDQSFLWTETICMLIR